MTDRARRKQIVAEYKQNPPTAGVYRIVNTQTGRSLVGTTSNLESIHKKLSFARKTNSSSALDLRLKEDFKRYGADAFEVEVLEELDVRREMTNAEIREELDVLEALCREQIDPDLLY